MKLGLEKIKSTPFTPKITLAKAFSQIEGLVLLEGPEHLHHVCVHIIAVGLPQTHHPY